MQDVKFPHVEVELVGRDGNAFAILGAVTKALRRANVSKEDIDAYQADATSGDYDNLLQVTLRTVTVN
jgi:cobalamin biosynthesis protein CbiG